MLLIKTYDYKGFLFNCYYIFMSKLEILVLVEQDEHLEHPELFKVY